MRRTAFALAALSALLAVPAGLAQRGGGGAVRIDGSSTVHPIMVATAELFRSEQPRVQVTVGVSGTGGGFKKFLERQPDLRTDVANASRPIQPSELELARERGVEFVELAVALDGIAICVNPQATFIDKLTVAELRRIWEPDSPITNWSQVRDGFPDLPLKLFGPGPDNGTFDYFTEAIVGEPRTRSDYSANENDNVLVQGVASEPGALGYFGYAYYHANLDRIRAVPVDPGDGSPVLPTLDTIRDGSYRPLSRPLFVYVNAESAGQPAVRNLFQFLFRNARQIVEHPKVSYVSLPPAFYDTMWRRLDARVTGTVMDDATEGTLAQRFNVE